MHSDLFGHLMFSLCSVIFPRSFSYNLKAKIQKLKLVSKKIFGNSENINLFTLKFYMLDHDTENESKLELHNYLASSLCKQFNHYFIYKIEVNKKICTLKGALKA